MNNKIIIFLLVALLSIVGCAEVSAQNDSSVLSTATQALSAHDKQHSVYIERVDSIGLLKDSANNVIGTVSKNGRIVYFRPDTHKNILSDVLPTVWGIIAIALVALLTVFIVMNVNKRRKQNEAKNAEGEQRKGIFDNLMYRNTVTFIISIVLLCTFVLGIFFLFIINCEVDSSTQVNEKWFEIFKSLLLLLGTSFTTIMGYFFGQGETTKLEKQAEELKSKLAQQKDEMKANDEKVEDYKTNDRIAEEYISKLKDQIAVLTQAHGDSGEISQK